MGNRSGAFLFLSGIDQLLRELLSDNSLFVGQLYED